MADQPKSLREQSNDDANARPGSGQDAAADAREAAREAEAGMRLRAELDALQRNEAAASLSTESNAAVRGVNERVSQERLDMLFEAIFAAVTGYAQNTGRQDITGIIGNVRDRNYHKDREKERFSRLMHTLYMQNERDMERLMQSIEEAERQAQEAAEREAAYRQEYEDLSSRAIEIEGLVEDIDGNGTSPEKEQALKDLLIAAGHRAEDLDAMTLVALLALAEEQAEKDSRDAGLAYEGMERERQVKEEAQARAQQGRDLLDEVAEIENDPELTLEERQQQQAQVLAGADWEEIDAAHTLSMASELGPSETVIATVDRSAGRSGMDGLDIF